MAGLYPTAPGLRRRGKIAHMEPTGLLGPLVGIVGKIVDYIRGRQSVRMRADVMESEPIPGGPTRFFVRRGVISIYNGGPMRFTVRAAGWEARDGTAVEADLPRQRTLDPGDPEMKATGFPAELLRAHDEHHGLVRMYVELAGEVDPRGRNLPRDWIRKVRELAERDRRDSRR
jgi:hypothetical protein